MSSPSWIRLERAGLCTLIAAAAVAGYWLGAVPRRISPAPSTGTSKDGVAQTPAPVMPSVPGTPQASESATNTAPDANRRPARAAMYQQMIAALNEPVSTERWMMLAGVLQGLSPENWRSAFQALDDERRLYGKEHPEARAFLVRRAGEVIGLAAITYLLEQKNRDAVASALTGWASKQPTEALKWLARQDEKERTQLTGHAIRGLSLTEPDLAISYLEQTPPAERRKYTPNLLATIERTAGIEQTQRLVDGMIERARSGGTLGEQYLTDVFRDLAEIKVRRAFVTGNVQAGIAWVDQHVGQPYVNYETVRNSAGQLAQFDPVKALTWIESVNTRAAFPSTISPVGYGTVLSTWVSQAGFEPVAQWLTNNPNHVAYDRMASYYADFALKQNPQIATQVAAAMKDPTVRAATLLKLQEAIDSRARGK